jgi:hypothetical protein
MLLIPGQGVEIGPEGNIIEGIAELHQDEEEKEEHDIIPAA